MSLLDVVVKEDAEESVLVGLVRISVYILSKCARLTFFQVCDDDLFPSLCEPIEFISQQFGLPWDRLQEPT